MSYCYLPIHEYFCCTTIQECFHHYLFMHIHFLYFYIQLYFSQYFKYPPYVSLCTPLFCCIFWTLYLYTVLLCFCLYRLYHYSSILPWLLLFCSIFWAQNSLPILFWHPCYHTFSSTLSVLYFNCFSFFCQIFSSSPCFKTSATPNILQLFSRDKTLFLVLLCFGVFVLAPLTLYKCYHLSPCLLSLFF